MNSSRSRNKLLQLQATAKWK